MRQLPISDQLKKNLQKGISTEPLFKKLKILSFEQQQKNSNRRIYVESEKIHNSKDSTVALLQMKYSIWTEYMARTTPNIIFHLQILNS